MLYISALDLVFLYLVCISPRFRNYSVCYFEYNWISEQMMDSVLKLTCVPTYALVCLNICNPSKLWRPSKT